jgi:hypothetical protein
MASSSTNPDTLVTLKVNIEGTNKRFKLPLRELGASTLPDKVRSVYRQMEGEAPAMDLADSKLSLAISSFFILHPCAIEVKC